MYKKIIGVIILVGMVALVPFLGNKEKGSKADTQVDEIIDIEDSSMVHGIDLSVQLVDQENKTIVYNIKSNSDTMYSYGEETRLEQLIDGRWEEVIPIEEMAVISIAYILKRNDENSHTMYIGNYNTLETGNYRVVKKIMPEDREDDETSDFSIYGTFEVK